MVWSTIPGHTTPSARAEVASQLFLHRASTPPAAQEGSRATFEASPQLGQLCLSNRNYCAMNCSRTSATSLSATTTFTAMDATLEALQPLQVLKTIA